MEQPQFSVCHLQREQAREDADLFQLEQGFPVC